MTTEAKLRRAARFTLIELLVAIGILALSLSGVLLLISQSQQEFIKARRQWQDQHAMTQAVEYFLLANPRSLNLPADFLPEHYYAECELMSVVDQMPEFAARARQGWMLAAYQIRLITDTGELVDEQIIYKIVREDLR